MESGQLIKLIENPAIRDVMIVVFLVVWMVQKWKESKANKRKEDKFEVAIKHLTETLIKQQVTLNNILESQQEQTQADNTIIIRLDSLVDSFKDVKIKTINNVKAVKDAFWSKEKSAFVDAFHEIFVDNNLVDKEATIAKIKASIHKVISHTDNALCRLENMQDYIHCTDDKVQAIFELGLPEKVYKSMLECKKTGDRHKLSVDTKTYFDQGLQFLLKKFYDSNYKPKKVVLNV